jgi:hypothetical protein
MWRWSFNVEGVNIKNNPTTMPMIMPKASFKSASETHTYLGGSEGDASQQNHEA